LQEAARGHGIDLAIYSARTPEDIMPAMDQAKTAGAAALNVLGSPLFAGSNRGIVLGRAAVLRLPAIYQWPEMAEEGGFAAYGPRRLGSAVRANLPPGGGVGCKDIPRRKPCRYSG